MGAGCSKRGAKAAVEAAGAAAAAEVTGAVNGQVVHNVIEEVQDIAERLANVGDATDNLPVNEDVTDKQEEPQQEEEPLPDSPPIRIIDRKLVGARAETARVVLLAARIVFTDDVHSEDKWNALISQHPNIVAPVMYIGDTLYADIAACLRYLVHEYAPLLTSDDAWEVAQRDMTLETLIEMQHGVTQLFGETNEQNRTEAWNAYRDDRLAKLLGTLERAASDCPSHGWLVAKKMSWIDLCVGDYLWVIRERQDENLLDNYSSLRKLVESVREHPVVSAHLNARETPELP